jgi:AcrR family transcriptional regulator
MSFAEKKDQLLVEKIKQVFYTIVLFVMKGFFGMSSEETKEKILEAATDEFSEFGYQKATIRNISRRAAVNLAAVNYHFSSKKELYRSVLEMVFGGEDDETEMPSGAGVDSQEKLESVLCEWINIFMLRLLGGSIEDDQRKYRICVHEMLYPSDILDELTNKYIRKDIEPLMSIISSGMPENTDRKRILIKVFSVLGRCFFYSFHRRFAAILAQRQNFARENFEAIVDEITKETATGLKYCPKDLM